MRQALDDCFLHDRDRLRHDEAIAILRGGRLQATGADQLLPLADCQGRIAGEDVQAPFDLPGHTNAAVDGYAYRLADAASGPLQIGQRVTAGMQADLLAPGTAARIFTGAPVPEGADTVAMQEDCEADLRTVSLPQIRKGANIRMRGEDTREGTPIIARGRRLTPADLASAAAFGLARLSVRPLVRIKLFSSGDEVRHDGALSTAEVFDANRPLLSAWLRHLPVEVTDGGILPDRRDAVETALMEASGEHDLILTTGGASRGEEDHMLAALDRLGTRHAWQIAVKPGRPLMFGRIGGAGYLGLPGNPVAACVCLLLYARPLILAMAGADWAGPFHSIRPAAFAIDSKPDRREFLRGIALPDGRIDKFARDGSGLLSSLREADGLIEIGEDVTRVSVGDPVRFLPWSSFY